MRIALIYPPTCDPTAPYLAVPMLTGFLRSQGAWVLPIDANAEAYDALLRPAPLAALRDRIERRIEKLERVPSLSHVDQLSYASLWRVRGDAHSVPRNIERAVASLRDEAAFYDADRYGEAVSTVEAALGVISAAHAPLQLDFTAWRTPFSLTTPEEIIADAEPDRDPFDAWVKTDLIPRLEAAKLDAIGLSVCFPGQIQPAFSFALKIKRALPGVHLTVGGPAITQILIRLQGPLLARALGPFDSAVVFEGEHSLLALLRALDEKRPLRELSNVVLRDPLLGARYVPAHAMEDLRALPAPDFDGLPLDRYLSPTLVLPYDPTRGCYWGKCTFCHYGLAEVGTASYRERSVGDVVEHLRALSERYETKHFYFSQDSVAPKTLVKLAEALAASDLRIRWATDLKPEKYLTAARAEILRKGGAVACALGVESASPRVLEMIDKGAPIEVVADVASHLASADIAVEAMCFTDFPTETREEAMATLRWLDRLRDTISLFIVGEFDLTHGALVAQAPEKFGLSEVWQLDGDQLGTGLFYEEKKPGKRGRDHERIDAALSRLSAGWRVRTYPWAGAISTAHTILYYDRFGAGIFRTLAEREPIEDEIGAVKTAIARFDLDEVADAMEREQEIWRVLVRDRRHVSRAAYLELAQGIPALEQKPSRYRFAAGVVPERSGPAMRTKPGRRPNHTPNSTG